MKVVVSFRLKFDRNVLLCPLCGFCVYSQSDKRRCAKCETKMINVCKESVYKKASRNTLIGKPTIINGLSIY